MRQHETRNARWTSGGTIVSSATKRATQYERKSIAPLVLIVDDDPSFRKAVALTLRGLCETIELSSGEGLEDFMENALPELVILDVNLPGRDGFDLCRAMRASPRWRAVPVIFLTAKGGDGPFELCLAARGDAFLTKPLKSADLVETVVRLLPEEGSAGPQEWGES